MIGLPFLSRLLPFLCAVVVTPAIAAPDDAVLLVLGDSLSAAYGLDKDQGWVTLLQRRLADTGRPVTVVNASISGETTAGGRSRLPRLLATHRPTLVVIELGANDGLRGLGIDTASGNLADMISMSRDAGAEVLIAGIRLPPNYGAAYTDAFQAAYRELADSRSVPLVPELLRGISEDRSLMQADELHPTAAAQPLILENLWPVLEPMLPAADAADRSPPSSTTPD